MAQKLLTLFVLSLLVLQAAAATIVGKVAWVCDGDTIWVVGSRQSDNPSPSARYKVRLNRIDAPESDQPFGKESKDYLLSLLRGKTVRIEYETEDQHGRILGIVYLDQTDINLQMVSTGNAWHYSHFDQTPAYAAAQAEAKKGKLGLWASENPINPYVWRKGSRRRKRDH